MATVIGIAIVLILAVGTIFYSFFPEDEPIEKAKMRRMVVKINLESLGAGGRTLAARRGAFYIVYPKRGKKKMRYMRIPAELLKIVIIDDYDYPYLEIRQEIVKYRSGREDVSRELYRLYIQKDRISRSFFIGEF